MNECLCPVIKNSAGLREQTSLLCYIQLKVHWNYNAKTMYTAWSLVCIELLEGFRQVLNPNPRHLGTWTSRYSVLDSSGLG